MKVDRLTPRSRPYFHRKDNLNIDSGKLQFLLQEKGHGITKKTTFTLTYP